MANPPLTPDSYQILEVTINGKDAFRSGPDLVRASYFVVQDDGWVLFKDHNHKAIRAYSPGTIHNVALTKKPGDAYAFHAATPITQIASDLANVLDDDNLIRLTQNLERTATDMRKGREFLGRLRAAEAQHPEWSAEQVYHSAVESYKSEAKRT